MTEKEVKEFYEELTNYYGSKLANHENYPRIFAHQVKIYRYIKERDKQ